MNDLLSLLNRKVKIFEKDINENEKEIRNLLENSKVLVLGGAGTIGQATTRELFKRKPKI